MRAQEAFDDGGDQFAVQGGARFADDQSTENSGDQPAATIKSAEGREGGGEGTDEAVASGPEPEDDAHGDTEN